MVWNRAGGNGLPRGFIFMIGADDGPIVAPAHGLEVHDAAVRSVGLEVNEPAFALGSFDITALMRTVDVGRALRQHDALVVRAVDLARAQDRLRSHADAAEGRKDVVIAVALIELGAFEGGQVLGSWTTIFPSSSTCLPSGDMRWRMSGPAPVTEWIR